MGRGIEQYTQEHTAKALVNYINTSKVTYNKIGTYSSTERRGKTDIVASGHQISDMNDKSIMNSPVTIYTPISTTSLDKSKLFINELNIPMKQLLRDYLETTDEPKEVIDSIIQKANDINEKKCLVIPIRPHTDCKINYSIEDIKKTRVLSKVAFISWETNKENYKLECFIYFEIETGKGKKNIRIPVWEYGDSFIPDKVEYRNGMANVNKSLIEITNIGIVKPIEITNGVQSLVVDGTYLYWLHNNVISVIGEWDLNGNLDINSDTAKALNKSDIFKYLKDNIPLISGHRTMIAPYKMYDIHTHTIKKSKAKEK